MWQSVSLLAHQLALKAATATSKLEGRLASEGDIRDAYHLTAPGQTRGPDGDFLAYWRAAVHCDLGGRGWQVALAELLGPDHLEDWLNLGTIRAATYSPLACCVAAIRAVLEVDDRGERVACLMSDIILARALGWSVVLPVSAQGLNKAMLRDLIVGG